MTIIEFEFLLFFAGKLHKTKNILNEKSTYLS